MLEPYPRQLAWREPPFEYEYRKLPFEIPAGSGRIRAELEKRTEIAEMERGWQAGLEEFREMRRKYLQY